MRIAVTRPEEDAGPLKARLEAMGHEVTVTPLLVIAPRTDVAIPDLPWQGVAVTSANGVRSLPKGCDLKSLRVLTVGPQSLKAARAAGLKAEAHGGDVHGLASFIRSAFDPNAGPILYLSGAETSGDLEGQLSKAGFTCHRAVLYDAVAASNLGETGDMLRQHSLDAVMLYSPRSARIWRKLVEQEKLHAKAQGLMHFCLSHNVAAALPEKWMKRVAATPDEGSMLALLDQTG